ncbi:HAD family hydrolase [Agromyces sp. NPDC058484]|uniref:HAD family hydrolase n=1 Tax=Agromyces sp. NPDC058484 TaxID=3346524 RepID=UPI003657DBBD
MKSKFVVFDLDDTLVSEVTFLESAYLEIARHLNPTNPHQLFKEMVAWWSTGENTFENLTMRFRETSMDDLLARYRNHQPDIHLVNGAADVLDYVKRRGYGLGLVTDGRSATQRNKLRALGIEHLFDRIVISEELGSSKPATQNFRLFTADWAGQCFYIGDNPAKDFLAPNALGWTTIMVSDTGRNIHSQEIAVPHSHRPSVIVASLYDVIDHLR